MMPEPLSYPLFLFIVFVVGACLGSFVTLVSYRLPREEDIVFKPSRCPQCGTTLGIADLFPLLSWLCSGASCRHCTAKVHFRYPLTELLLGLTCMAVAWRFGPTGQTVLVCLLATALAVLIVTDFEHMIIPDSVQVAVLVVGILYAVYHDVDWSEPALSVLLFGGLGLALHYGYPYFRKKDGLGFGDVKFLAASGVWLPLSAFPVYLFMAGIMGIVTWALWRRLGGGELFPFGPALALSLFVNVCFPGLAGCAI